MKKQRRGQFRIPDPGGTEPHSQQEWFKTETGKKRLEKDKILVSEKFPDLRLYVPENGNPPYWLGHISFRTSIGKRYSFRLRIVYPVLRYPVDDVLPDVYDEDSVFKPYPGKRYTDRHIIKLTETSKSRFCLTLPVRREIPIQEPDGFVLFLCAVIGYLEKQVIYDLNGGIWPGPDEEHGKAAFARFYLEEALGPRWQNDLKTFERLLKILYDNGAISSKIGRNAPCPCGSGRKAKTCHGHALNQARCYMRSLKLHLQ